MKFLEEIIGGDCFLLDSKHFILTSDFKKNKKDNLKLCISLADGTCRWFADNTLVEPVPIFTIDMNGDILAIKETKKQDELNP